MSAPKGNGAKNKFAKSVCIFGSGAFGTAMSSVFARKRGPNGERPDVRVWHLDPTEAAKINEAHSNIYFLKKHRLPHNVTFTADVNEALNGAELILSIIPTQFMRGFYSKHAQLIFDHLVRMRNDYKKIVPIVNCAKGIEKKTLMFPAQIVADILKPYEGQKGIALRKHLMLMAGPTFASEVVDGYTTCVTLSAEEITSSREFQGYFNVCPNEGFFFDGKKDTPMKDLVGMFRCYASEDMISGEVSSAIKNVIAIATGAITGSGAGQNNARAAVITRALFEMAELTEEINCITHKNIFANVNNITKAPLPHTKESFIQALQAVNGLVGTGDTLLTCSSENSRNFTVGLRLGRGETLKQIYGMAEKSGGKGTGAIAVAEGVATASSLHDLCVKLKLYLPLCETVYKVLYCGMTVKEAFEALLMTPLEDEMTSRKPRTSSKL